VVFLIQFLCFFMSVYKKTAVFLETKKCKEMFKNKNTLAFKKC
jgi:hypothetical protein